MIGVFNHLAKSGKVFGQIEFSVGLLKQGVILDTSDKESIFRYKVIGLEN